MLTISVDGKHVHKMWVEYELSRMTGGDIPWPMVSDPGGRIGRIYNVYDQDEGVDIRGRFIIDPDGVIQAMEVLTPPVGRRIDETLRQFQAYQRVRNSGGTEACPVDWTPGSATLKPGPDLVGRVWETFQQSLEG